VFEAIPWGSFRNVLSITLSHQSDKWTFGLDLVEKMKNFEFYVHGIFALAVNPM